MIYERSRFSDKFTKEKSFLLNLAEVLDFLVNLLKTKFHSKFTRTIFANKFTRETTVSDKFTKVTRFTKKCIRGSRLYNKCMRVS